MKTTIKKGQSVVDEYLTTFGFRTVKVTSDEGFFLNGKYVKLNGVCLHHDLGSLGTAVNYRALERQMESMKEMGVNALRTSHNQPAPELLEICDRLGIMVIVESYDYWGTDDPDSTGKSTYDYGRFFYETREENTKAWIKRDRNHPSTIMWSVANEIYELGNNNGAQAKELCDFVREEDPRKNALTTFGSNIPSYESVQKVGANIVDVFGHNYQYQYMDEIHEKWPDSIIYCSESSSAVRSRGVYLTPSDVYGSGDAELSQLSSYDNTFQPYASSAEFAIKFTQSRKWNLGEFIWTGADYLGEPLPAWYNKNAHYGAVDTAGIKKDSYYLYQSVWTDAEENPMVHILPYWNQNLACNGGKVDVWAYSNGEKVELFFDDGNGEESLGTWDVVDPKKLDSKLSANFNDYREDKTAREPALHGEWKVPYKEGTLIAKAYDAEGNVIATDKIESFGHSAKIDMQADRQEITADGKDLIYVETSILDENNVLVANAANRVEFKVTGAGKLLTVDNGDSSDYEPYIAPARRAFSGKLVAIIQSDGTGGDIKITAASDGLTSKTITVPAVHKQSVTSVALDSINGATAISTSKGTLKMVATVWPENADYEKVAYTVTETDGSSTDKAAIDKNGVLKALKNGTVKVTATALDGSKKSSSKEIVITGQGTVTQVSSISVTGNEIKTDKSSAPYSIKTQMSASVQPSNATIKDVEWSVVKPSSSIPALAEINNDGVLVAKYDGTVTVRATAKDGSGVYGETQVKISGQNVTVIGSLKLKVQSGTTGLTNENPTAVLKVTTYPDTDIPIEWKVIPDDSMSGSVGGVKVDTNAETGETTVTATKNGKFRIMASTRNNSGPNAAGTKPIKLYDIMSFTASGFPEQERDAYKMIEAASYDAADGNHNVIINDATYGTYVKDISIDNTYFTFKDVDFGEDKKSETLIIRGSSGRNSTTQPTVNIEIHEGDPNGELLGTVNFKVTGGWYNFEEQTFNLSGITGKHDLCFVLKKAGMYFDYFQFTGVDAETGRDPYTEMNGNTYDDASKEFNKSNTNGSIGSITNGDYLGFKNLNFGKFGSQQVVLTGGNNRSSDGVNGDGSSVIDLYDGNPDDGGIFLARGALPKTGGWNEWGSITVDLPDSLTSIHDIYVKFPDSGWQFKSIKFIENSYLKIQAEDYDDTTISGKASNYTDESNKEQTVVPIAYNEQLDYNKIDFGDGSRIKVSVKGKLGDGASDKEGPLWLYCNGRDALKINFSNKNADSTGYSINTGYISGFTGKQKLSIVSLSNEVINLDWIRFDYDSDIEVCNVTLNPTGGSVTPATIEVESGEAIGTLPVPVRSDGYTFKGWYTAETGGEEVTASTLVNGDMTIYAQWEVIPDEDVIIQNAGFENGLENWEAVDEAKLSLGYMTLYEGARSLKVSERKKNTSGVIQDITGKVEKGKTYDVTVAVLYKNSENTDAPDGVKFKMNILYGDTETSAGIAMATGIAGKDNWKVIKGTYTVPADADLSQVRVMIATEESSNPVTYYADYMTMNVTSSLIQNGGFENGIQDWEAYEESTLGLGYSTTYTGNRSLKISGRTKTSSGATQDITGKVEKGKTYAVRAAVRYNTSENEAAAGETTFHMSVFYGDSYVDSKSVGNMGTVKAGPNQWSILQGNYTIPADADLSKVRIFFETSYQANPTEQDLVTYFIDDVSMKEVTGEEVNANAADAVQEMILMIGTVEFSETSKARIDAAREAYDKLTEEQKKLILNYSLLTAAEERYTQLAEEPAVSPSPSTSTQPAVSPTPKVSVAPMVSTQPTASVKPTASIRPTADVKPTASVQPAASITPQNSSKPTDIQMNIKEGNSYKVGVYTYKVTSIAKRTVAVTGTTKKNLKTIRIGNIVKLEGKNYKITAVAPSAFKQYKSVKKVSIGKNVKVIGNKSFYGCRKLSKVTMIGKGLNKIGNKSFGKCKKLKSIVIKSKVLKSAGQQAFWGTNKKAVIKVPSQKRKLYGKILKKAGLSNSIIIR